MDNFTHIADEFIGKAMLPSTVIYTVALLIGLFGNAGVFFIYLKKMPSHRFEQRYFIPVLSLFDILVCAVSLIYYIIQTYKWITFYSDELCKMMVFLIVFTMMTSDAFLLTIAIQRYIMIRRPFGKQMDLKWRRISVTSIIFSGLVYSIPSLIVAGVSDFVIEYQGVNISGQSCYSGNKHYPLLQVIYHGILIFIGTANIILTAVMYAPIAVVIVRRRNRRNSSWSASKYESSTEMTSSEGHIQQHMDSVTQKQRTAKVNFNLMFLIIILLYVLSYIPTAVINSLISVTKDYYRHLGTTEYGVSDIFVKFYTFNHVANPFIYAYFDTEFRNCLKKIFKYRAKTELNSM